MTGAIGELNPPPRLLMGPGPITCDPRVLRALSTPLLGQFDPAFTAYMNEVMALYRRLYQTANRWTFLVDGTARAGIEAILVSLISGAQTRSKYPFSMAGIANHQCGKQKITPSTRRSRSVCAATSAPA